MPLVKLDKVERLPIGNWPKALGHVQHRQREYRQRLEAETVKVHGKVSFSDAHLIDAAVTHHLHAMMARHILVNRHTEMSPTQILSASLDHCKAKELRNRAVRELRLEAPHDPAPAPSDPISSFYTLDDDDDEEAPSASPNELKDTGATSEPTNEHNASDAILGDDASDITTE